MDRHATTDESPTWGTPEGGGEQYPGGQGFGRRRVFGGGWGDYGFQGGGPGRGEKGPGGGRGERRWGPFGPGGFGPGGFGPGGFGPGFPGGFGRGGHGHGGPGGWGRGGRRSRGNVRAAVLALLAEEPRHGYAIMTELTERSGGLWRPSPGIVYPVLQQLQDEGLVRAEEADGRRVFSLTDAGRELVAANPAEFAEPWSVGRGNPRERFGALFGELPGLLGGIREVARTGSDAQIEQARVVLEDARRAVYRILAGDAPDTTRDE